MYCITDLYFTHTVLAVLCACNATIIPPPLRGTASATLRKPAGISAGGGGGVAVG